MYYLIDPAYLTILSGPHGIQDPVIKRLTSCGNPECLSNLAEYGIVPAVYPTLGANQRHSSTPVVTAEAVTFPPEDIPLETLKATKRTALAAIRYQHEVAGITLNGTTIRTDRESQSLINGAYSYSLLNPSLLVDWKAETGWVLLNAAAIVGISGAVAAHVQNCFSNEKVLSEAIDAAEDTDELDAIDLESGWST